MKILVTVLVLFLCFNAFAKTDKELVEIDIEIPFANGDRFKVSAVLIPGIEGRLTQQSLYVPNKYYQVRVNSKVGKDSKSVGLQLEVLESNEEGKWTILSEFQSEVLNNKAATLSIGALTDSDEHLLTLSVNASVMIPKEDLF